LATKRGAGKRRVFSIGCRQRSELRFDVRSAVPATRPAPIFGLGGDAVTVIT
jgi:hypothetical protein